MKRTIYKEIKKVMPYQMCRNEVIGHLPSKFTYYEFEYVFLLAFDPMKKYLILRLGLKEFRKWLKRYYLPRVARKYKPPYSIKGMAQKWVVNLII